MHRRETRVLLRHYLEQGVSKTELAKRFGISRRTVYHWIETGQLDRDLDNQEVRYRARPPVTTRLDPYKPIIQARLEAFRCSLHSGCSRSCAARAIPAGTRSSRSSCGRCDRMRPQNRWCASRRRRDIRAKWTLGPSSCRGDGVMRCSWS